MALTNRDDFVKRHPSSYSFKGYIKIVLKKIIETLFAERRGCNRGSSQVKGMAVLINGILGDNGVDRFLETIRGNRQKMRDSAGHDHVYHADVTRL